MLLRARVPRLEARSQAEPENPARKELSGLQLLRREPYLRNLALLVALGAAMSALLDYLFSLRAAVTFAKGAPLLTFFSLFWLAVAVLSLLIQLALGERALTKLGLAANIAHPAWPGHRGGIVALAAPGFFSTSILRGRRRSSATPFTAPRTSCSTRRFGRSEARDQGAIDIGLDRLGTIAAAGL